MLKTIKLSTTRTMKNPHTSYSSTLTVCSPNMGVLCFFLFWSITFFTTTTSTSEPDTLTATQTLTTNQTLQSSNGVFILGFFAGRTNPNYYYLGIWYKNLGDRTVVWVANRDNPLENSTGLLKINVTNGNLVLVSSSGIPVWSSIQTAASNPVLQLLDTGNLVLIREEANMNNSPAYFLWQSFDYPTDTLLPDMKMGREEHLTSWKDTDQDPSTGDYTFKIEFKGLAEIFLRKNQSTIYRSGPWNGKRFSGLPEMGLDTVDSIVFNFSPDQNGKVKYYYFHLGNGSIFSRVVVTSDGKLERLTWVPSSQSWNKFWSVPKDQCDNYRMCGAFGICDANASPVCKCMTGFRPKNLQGWRFRYWSDGCVRNSNLDCKTDKFLHMQNLKLPEITNRVFVNRSMNLVECKDLCSRNCSCSGYANIKITNGGSGCVMWMGELIDMRQFLEGAGQDLYVRLAASDVDDLESTDGSHKKNFSARIAGITICVAVVTLGLGVILFRKRKLLTRFNGKTDPRGPLQRSRDLLMNQVIFSIERDGESSREMNMDELELPMFDFNTIAMATNNFSEENKLGEGGFGSVYRGSLMEGHEIAVKRLSKNSGQGTEEFLNEVKLIVKLQHRNLVRLFGCCIEMDEKLLVYEYLEIKSLDSILFDKARKDLLDWKKRFNIICGIARGLLYLHHDSRFKIIHRDLKTSNILLDSERNPKISDFGMARIFGTNQIEANTLRVVGTYGYMSPEYAMYGKFSVKSDVFSFGVLVLEIISGKKNRGYNSSEDTNLLEHAWRLWREGNALRLIDQSINDSNSISEVLRCIHIGLLCVQECAQDRPTMSSVILMLNSEVAIMPQPRNPGFSLGTSKVPVPLHGSARRSL